MLIGRDNEQSILLGLLEKPESQFCVVYGRRRVGKTYLIRQGQMEEQLFSLMSLSHLLLSVAEIQQL